MGDQSHYVYLSESERNAFCNAPRATGGELLDLLSENPGMMGCIVIPGIGQSRNRAETEQKRLSTEDESKKNDKKKRPIKGGDKDPERVHESDGKGEESLTVVD